MTQKLIVYLPEGFADWEGSYLLPELAENKIPYVIVSETGKPVTSIGRLRVTPDAGILDINKLEISGLIMIGSDTWQDPSQNRKAIMLAAELLSRQVLVAAICAATIALAREGLLDQRKHTSNDLAMLKKIVPTYKGEQFYLNQLAVTDGNLITASGIGPIEFAKEVINSLRLFSDEKMQHWFKMFKTGTQPPPSFWGL